MNDELNVDLTTDDAPTDAKPKKKAARKAPAKKAAPRKVASRRKAATGAPDQPELPVEAVVPATTAIPGTEPPPFEPSLRSSEEKPAPKARTRRVSPAKAIAAEPAAETDAPSPESPATGSGPAAQLPPNPVSAAEIGTPSPTAAEDDDISDDAGATAPADPVDASPGNRPSHDRRQHLPPGARPHSGPPVAGPVPVGEPLPIVLPGHQGSIVMGSNGLPLVLEPDGTPKKLNRFQRFKLRKLFIRYQRSLDRGSRPASPPPDRPLSPTQQNGRLQKPFPARNDRDRNDRNDRDRNDRNDRNDRDRSDRDRSDRDRSDRDRSDRDRNGRDRNDRDFERGDRPEPEPTGPVTQGEGMLEISGKGFGFLRQRFRNYGQHPHDIFVTPEMVRNYGLRDGVILEGDVRNGFRGPQLVELRKINGREPSDYRNLPIFEELTAVNPAKRIVLETTPDRTTTRVIDMIAPIGRGQRGLIVAPPRTGKTTLLQHIAEAVSEKHPELHLMILLVDERPEEVTEITRMIPQAEIFASSNDNEPKAHLRIATIAIERAKRLVEAGEHVFIVLDSITRLARASNNAVTGGGRKTMSGGIDSRALELPRRLFAAARNTREGGSLTIVATALIETNSKADDLIFQEFKGTGNMELILDRKVAQQYVFPAVDIFKSGTRREELLLPPHQLEKINLIRRGLAGHKPIEAIERMLHFVRRHPSNAQMLLDIPKSALQ